MADLPSMLAISPTPSVLVISEMGSDMIVYGTESAQDARTVDIDLPSRYGIVSTESRVSAVPAVSRVLSPVRTSRYATVPRV